MSGFRFVIPIGAFGGGQPSPAITVIPDKGFTKNVTPRVLLAKFGDGYSQRLSDGINPIEEMYSVAFKTRDRDEIDDIVKFFEAGVGVQPFDLIVNDHSSGVTAPNEKTVKVICTRWSQVYFHDLYYTSTATFERVYTPVVWS
jgi:phage-related protein